MKLSEFLQKANSEDNGNPSSIRINSTWAVFWFVIVLSFAMIYAAIAYENIVIPLAGILAGIILGVLGIKNSQKQKEQEITDDSKKPEA